MNKTLYYYGAELDEKETKRSGFPCGTIGLFSYTLKDGENEKEVRERIEQRCIKNSNGSEALVPERYQSFPISMSKYEMEKQTRYHKVKMFYWVEV